ncbi:MULTISPECIES: mercuric transporter MerT family protein [unclassified Mesorhizobium]|uniref:mercuric transporter MerT family protein n=1 Tax=unclassified Mesorhizobium TaxID=325217 RepID=UPI00112D0A62|nr:MULTISPECIES: mercuric transporter MerT family protein [unclassified Mesorhizobium]TPJ76710.1 mercury transporter MerT [Mesorhizobium sp. B2-6-2]TPO10680.1 mercury transporter MerT [Mesorhizobium sp. B1-1-5]
MSGPLPVSNLAKSRAALSLALGGLSAGLLASACCVLPLAFALVGISGAWIARLTALAPYQPYFLTLAAVSIGLGFWRYRRNEAAACLAGSLCASPVYRRSTQFVLLAASLIAVAAAAVDVFGRLNL